MHRTVLTLLIFLLVAAAGFTAAPDFAEEYKEAESGNADAQFNLGAMYDKGEGVTKDLAEAAKWYRQAAEQGLAVAQSNLGSMYANGEGVQKDSIEAVKWYRKAAEQGYAKAQKTLGFMLEQGKGVPKDSAEAVKWYRLAADQGYAEAQNKLGEAYANGTGVLRNATEAVKWFRKAAERGYAMGQKNLGNMYAKGEGIPKDSVEALKWFRKSAEQGLAMGQYNLALTYQDGIGVPNDAAEAIKWYRVAADQGFAPAQINLGYMYANGEGVPKDATEAVKWWRKAADQGNTNAQKALTSLLAEGQNLASTSVAGGANSTDSVRRFALVIGNAKYKSGPLRNPENDADAMSDALEKSRFKVIKKKNVNLKQMRDAVREFTAQLGKNDVGLFYFSGHGTQIKGKNYLIPVESDIESSDEIATSALDADFILSKLESIGNQMNILILDACRSAPAYASSRSGGSGLANMDAAKGTFIAFATAPGKTASDGSGINSPYTKYLVSAIGDNGLPLEQVFKKVRRQVVDETNGVQVPWENSSILGDFYFRK